MASQITANLPTLNFPREVDYPTQEDWAAFSAAAELNFGILGGSWSTQMQNWKDQANAMSIELNNSADIAQSIANYQGDWTSKGYTLGQTVSVSGVYYICKLTHITGQNPTTGGSLYWNIVLGNWNLKVDKVASTDNAIVRFDGTTGEVQNSGVIIDDNGNVGIGDPSPQYKLSISQSTVLPSTAGSKITSFSKYTNVGNNSYLRFDTVRITAGNSHHTSEERIQKVVDISEMGYVAFGTDTVKFGNAGGERVLIDYAGNLLLTSGTGGLGYGTGSGGVVTQLTSKTTAVTLNKPSGKIITSSSALGAGETVGFILNNILLTGNDIVKVIVGDAGANGAYQVDCVYCIDGAANITIKNIDSILRIDIIAINFIIIKGSFS